MKMLSVTPSCGSDCCHLYMVEGPVNASLWFTEAEARMLVEKMAACLLPMVAVEVADSIIYTAREKMSDRTLRRVNEDRDELSPRG